MDILANMKSNHATRSLSKGDSAEGISVARLCAASSKVGRIGPRSSDKRSRIGDLFQPAGRLKTNTKLTRCGGLVRCNGQYVELSISLSKKFYCSPN